MIKTNKNNKSSASETQLHTEKDNKGKETETHREEAKSMSQQSEDDTERRSALSNTRFHDNSLAGPLTPWLVCNESSALKVR